MINFHKINIIINYYSTKSMTFYTNSYYKSMRCIYKLNLVISENYENKKTKN